MNEKNLALMDEIMGAVIQLDEWQDIQLHDSRIASATARMSAALKQVENLLPLELYNELCEASSEETAYTSNAGILFGIHVADAIRDVASRPADLSRHILERTGRATV